MPPDFFAPGAWCVCCQNFLLFRENLIFEKLLEAEIFGETFYEIFGETFYEITTKSQL